VPKESEVDKESGTGSAAERSKTLTDRASDGCGGDLHSTALEDMFGKRKTGGAGARPKPAPKHIKQVQDTVQHLV
jgi:hypothetical protein